ncbi:MAG: TAXI family TRAP transporter solute-binding subunit [Clostridiales bacterium]|nr:TAXI family TRAP transporter solute-binding subunit [Clostridiales bacterium]
MKKLTKIFALVSALMIAVFAFTGCGDKKLKFATGGTGGTYYAYGSALSTLTTNNTSTKVTAISTGASADNILRVNKKKADIAIVQNDVAFYAYTGTDLFASNGAQKNIRIVGYMYSEPCQIVARSGINSIEDLRGATVSVGAVGSGVEFNAKQILAAYDISFGDINKRNLDFNGSADALKNGQIDAFFCVAGAPTTAITDLATTKGINLLSIDDDHIAILQSTYDFYKPYTVPAGTYNGINADVKMVTVKATIIAHKNVSNKDVYNILDSAFKATKVNHAKFEELSLESCFDDYANSTVPFHDGAIEYYNEHKEG